MDKTRIERRRRAIIRRHGAWTNHNVRLAEGIYTIAPAASRADCKLRRVLQIVMDHVDGGVLAGKRVLDLACLEGMYGLELALHGARVVGIEGREANLVKARFTRDVLGLEDMELLRDDVRNLSVERHGTFDVVLCLGILYHLDAPDVFEFLARVAEVCMGFAILDTHLASSVDRHAEWRGRTFDGQSFTEHAPGTRRVAKERALWASLDNETSFWMTRHSLFDVLADLDFASVYECHHPAIPAYEALRTEGDGDRTTFVAIKGKSPCVLSTAFPDELSANPWPTLRDRGSGG